MSAAGDSTRLLSCAIVGLACACPVSRAGNEAPAACGASFAHGGLARASEIFQDLTLPAGRPAAFTTQLRIRDVPYTLMMSRRSLRAPGFRLRVQVDGGQFVAIDQPPPVLTYHGAIVELPGSTAAGSLNDGRLTARVLLPGGGSWTIEPVPDGFSSAPNSTHRISLRPTAEAPETPVYGLARAVASAKEASGRTASGASTPSARTASAGSANVAGLPGSVPHGCALAEIAFDADNDFHNFVNACQSDEDCPWSTCDTSTHQCADNRIENTLADIENVLNQVDAIFRRDVDVRFTISEVLIRDAAASDPYASSNNNCTDLMCDFANEWNYVQTGVHRDVVHLLTAKALLNAGGCSHGLVCGDTASEFDTCDPGGLRQYSISADQGPLESRVRTMAHELGHNFDACHCNRSACYGGGTAPECNLMCTSPGACSETGDAFADFSAGAIASFRDSVDCLTNLILVDGPGHQHSGNDTGWSWEESYVNVQGALDDANSVCAAPAEVWVAKGTYKPSRRKNPSDPRSATYQLLDRTGLYGGFTFGMTAREQRDPDTNITILSGDIGAAGVATDNAYRIVDGTGVDATAVLDGFRITGGYADGTSTSPFYNRGGGMFVSGGSPTVRGCVFADNYAQTHGGAMSNFTFADPTVIDSVFVGNRAASGGAMENSYDSAPLLIGCLFTANEATGAGGGGMLNVNDASPILIGGTFVGNAQTAGGGNGGGMFNWVGGSPSMTNLLFAGNYGRSKGGAIANNDGHPLLINSTLVDNEVLEISGGGIYSGNSSHVDVHNGILWGNRDGSGTSASAQITSSNSSATILHSCVQGIRSSGSDGNTNGDPKFVGGSSSQWTASPTYDPATLTTTFANDRAFWAEGALTGKTLNPDTSQALQALITGNTQTTVTAWGDFSGLGFAGSTYKINDYRIRDGSSALDSGDNALVPADSFDLDDDGDTSESLPVDRADNDRIVGATVDMGAHEGAVAGHGITINPGYEHGLEPWAAESEEEDGPPAVVTTQSVPPMESALHIHRPPDPNFSSGWAHQQLDVNVAPLDTLTLSFDVLIQFHSFAEYQTRNVYPANVWVDYLDAKGLPHTFRRSFFTDIAPGHEPDPPPLAELLLPGGWGHRVYDLAEAVPPVARIVAVRAGAQGHGYDVAFDNVLLQLEPPCTEVRDHDETREAEATIDYNDDFMEKTIDIADELTTANSATLWLYGQPYNYPGQEFVPREDYRIRVNADPSREIAFDVGAVFGFDDTQYQWISFDVPLAWLAAGSNTFYIYEDSPPGAWDHNNLRVGVDEHNDNDRSWWYGNGVFECLFNPAGCTGELMMHLELCHEAAPGDCDGDRLVAFPDIADLAECIGGPGAPYLPRCVCVDTNNDNAVDLIDAAAVQVMFASPGD